MEIKINHPKIVDWLLSDKKSTWERGTASHQPNTYYSKSLQAVYIYSNRIKYWEDIRHGGYIETRIPIDKEELFSFINEGVIVIRKPTFWYSIIRFLSNGKKNVKGVFSNGPRQ